MSTVAVETGFAQRRMKHVVRLTTTRADGVDGPYLGLENIESFTGRIVATDGTVDGETANAFRAGDLLFGKLRPYLVKVHLAEFDGRCTSEALVLRATSCINPRFLRYLCVSDPFIQAVNSSTYGAQMPRASWSFIGNVGVPLPDIEVQRAIADFLDRKTAAIDALIEKKERLIALLEEKRQALITQAVTKGLNPTAPLKNTGIPWLCQIPEHWELFAVKRTARSGHKTFTDGDWIEAPYITDEGVRLLQTGNVGIGEFREKGFRYVSEDTCRSLRCTAVDPGDVLVCRLDGPVGRACLAPKLGLRMITSVDNAIIKVGPHFDPRFIVYFMSSGSWLSWIQSICRVGGGFRVRISRTMLGELKLASPPLHEQRTISLFLDQATSEIAANMGMLRRSCELLREYRQTLITAAVTGQLEIASEAA